MTRNRLLSSRAIPARSLVAAAGLAAVAATSAFAQQVDSNWLSPVSGTWNVGTNWSTAPNAPNNGAPAGTTYRAIIDAAGAAYTVTLNSGVTIDELVLNSADATLSHTASTLSAAIANLMSGVYRLQGGTISGGTWNVTGGSFQLTSSGGTLSNVQFNGDLLGNATSSFVTLGGTTRFDALRLQANNAQVRLNAGYTINDAIVSEGAVAGARQIYNSAAGTYTISDTGSITLAAGSGGDLGINNFIGNMNLVNDGLISAQAAGRTLTIAAGSFTNNATTEATAGTLTISSANWTNNGLIQASNSTLNLSGSWSNASGQITVTDSLLNLGGSFTTAALGAITRTGGTVDLSGSLNNDAAALSLNASTGSWNLRGGTITGGTVNTSGGSTLLLTNSGGTLSNVQFNGDILAETTSAFVSIGGTTRFDALRLRANNAQVRLNAGYTINDAIVSEGAVAGARQIYNSAAGTYTISDTGSITLAAGSGGDLGINNFIGNMNLVNDGLISAQAAGRTLTIAAGSFTNNATTEATAGTLTISSANWTNNGLIQASNATLNLSGSWSNQTGQITVNNSLLNLGGSFTTAGLGAITRTGGTVDLTGSLNNATDTLTLDAASGSWNLRGGTITGGTVNTSGGSTLLLTNSGGTLNNVQFNGDILADATSAFVNIAGATRFDTLRLQGNNTQARLIAGFTLRDAIVSDDATGGTRLVYNMGAGTYTISDTGSITLASGSGGNLQINAFSGAFDLVNDGLISANAAGRTLTVNTSSFTNNATVETTTGTLALSSTNWTNAGLIQASNATLNLSGSWSNQTGQITVNNSLLNLGGSFTTAGLGAITRTGGTVDLTGSLNNATDTLTLDAASGSWNLRGGTITGGTVNTSGGSTLLLTTSGGTLSNVQFNGDVLANATSSFVNLAGATRFDTLRLQGNNTQARLNAGYTINDAIVSEGAAGGTRQIYNNAAGTYTIADTGSVTLAAGSGGDLSISTFSGAFDLVNDGLISAKAAGRTLTINTTSFTNNATLEAQNSSALRVATPGVYTNSADLVVGTNGRIEFVNGFEQASGGVLTVELSGGANTGAGRLAITGNATLGGTLDLSPVGAFEPTWNNAWTIATTTTGTISGDFDSILFPTLADSDHRWWTEINPTSYRVGVRHFADLNYDGVINFADLNIVLSGFGTMGTFRQGDTNADGLVNFSDLNNILSFFGVAAPRAAVPAPGAAVILALGALGVARRRRD